MNLSSPRSFAPLALLLGLSIAPSAFAQSATVQASASTSSASGASGTGSPPPAAPLPHAPPAANSAGRTVQVLGLDSDNADDQVEALTAALRARVRGSTTWSLGNVSTSLSMVTAALKCPQHPDEACTQRMGDELKSDRIVYGWINRSGPHEVTAEVHLWARGQREVVATEKFSDSVVSATDPKLGPVVDRIAEKLLGEKPISQPPKEETRKKIEEEPKQASHGPSTQAIIGWTAIGLGVGAAAFGAVEGVRFLSKQSDNKDQAKTINQGVGVCEAGNQAACDTYDSAKSARTLEFVGIGAGAVLIGTGVVLLLTDHHKEAPPSSASAKKWQINPQAGPRGGRVDLQIAF